MLVGTLADENLAHDPAMKARYILICVILHNAYHIYRVRAGWS